MCAVVHKTLLLRMFPFPSIRVAMQVTYVRQRTVIFEGMCSNQAVRTMPVRSTVAMTPEELNQIRSWDKRCGDNEGTFFPVTIDRRRLLEYVDELRAELASLTPPPT